MKAILSDSKLFLSIILFLLDSTMLTLILDTSITSRLKPSFSRVLYLLTRVTLQIARSKLMLSLFLQISDLPLLLINLALDFLLTELFWSGKHYRKLLTVIVFYAICFASEYITVAVFAATGILSFEPVEYVSELIIFMALVSRSVLPGLTIGYIKLRGKLYGRIRSDAIKKAALMPPPLYLCVFFLMFHPLGDNTGLFYRNPKLVFTASFLTAVISTVYMVLLVLSISKERRLSEKVEYQFLLLKSIEATIRQLSGDHKRLTAAYHDIGNILSAMEMISKSDEVRSLRENLDAKLVSTGNIHIDAMIFAKRNELLKVGLKLKLRGTLPDSIDWIDPIDLFIIMGNALDNAIEALEKIPSNRCKAIEMELAYGEQAGGGHILAIRVKNMAADLSIAEDRFLSTKKAPGHGNGLKNIEYAVQRAGGTMSVSADKEHFTLSIMLYESGCICDNE